MKQHHNFEFLTFKFTQSQKKITSINQKQVNKMATYRKTHFVGIIVSAVMIAFLIIFLLKQYVLTINIKDKGPSTINVINPQLNDSFYDSYSGSGLAFGSASGRDSNFHLRSRNVMSMGLDSSSNSNSQDQTHIQDQTQLHPQAQTPPKLQISKL